MNVAKRTRSETAAPRNVQISCLLDCVRYARVLRCGSVLFSKNRLRPAPQGEEDAASLRLCGCIPGWDDTGMLLGERILREDERQRLGVTEVANRRFLRFWKGPQDRGSIDHLARK